MEPTTGLEPVTSSLPRKCSTAELCGPLYKMERVMGIEPTSSAWKAEVLPLNYTRNLANNSRLAVSGRTQSIQFRRRTLMKHSKMNLSTSGRGSSTLNDRKKNHRRLTWRRCRILLRYFIYIYIGSSPCFQHHAEKTIQSNSYPTSPPNSEETGGGGRIRTYVGIASRFTVCPR
jgi:hypothetical protein